jgi:hypothetical protein
VPTLHVALLFTDATRVSFLTQASIAFTPVLAGLALFHVIF